MNRSSLLGAKLAVPLLALFMTAPLFGSGSFWFQIPNGAAAVGEEVSIPVFLHSESLDVLGWSFGLCHDPAVLTVNSVGVGEATDLALGGANPYFFVTEIEPESYSVALVLDSLPFTYIPPGPSEIIVGTYSHQLTLGESTVVTPCATLGPPPTSLIVLAIDSSNVPASATPGTWFGGSAPFVRGDVNDDGAVNLGDVIFLLAELFAGGEPGPCPIAKDVNDDGAIDIADPIELLGFLFQGGGPPPPPFPDCGQIPNQQLDQCPSSQSCGGGL